jgi:hypothetical protein
MKTLLHSLFVGCVTVLVFAPPAVAVETSSTPNSQNRAKSVPSEARRLALETAGAFVNDGFRIRDGEWNGTLTKGNPLFLQVTLFAGENYWFVAASPVRGGVIRVTLYDSAGKPVKGEQWKAPVEDAGAKSAAGVAPAKSGAYFVGVELLEQPDSASADFSLVYAYK